MEVLQFLKKLFVGKGKVLSWERVRDDHVVDENDQIVPAETPFEANQHYVVMRIGEMYLKTIRVLWREKYPVVHAFTSYGDPSNLKTTNTVAGPGQLKDLGTTNLDRLIGLAYRIAGPIVYDGQDIELLAGLYAVPAKDWAKAMLETLSQLSGIVPALAEAQKVAGVLTSGVSGLLGLDDTVLALGIHYVLRPGPTPGYWVAINAPSGSMDSKQLWVKDHRLYVGETVQVAEPYDQHDMMLVQVEKGPSRARAYATIPSLAEHSAAFDQILKQTSDLNALKTQLNSAFAAFDLDVTKCAELTDPDKAAVRALVANDLTDRVAKIGKGGPLFEVRSLEGIAPMKIEYRSFSPSALPDEIPQGRAGNRPLF